MKTISVIEGSNPGPIKGFVNEVWKISAAAAFFLAFLLIYRDNTNIGYVLLGFSLVLLAMFTADNTRYLDSVVPLYLKKRGIFFNAVKFIIMAVLGVTGSYLIVKGSPWYGLGLMGFSFMQAALIVRAEGVVRECETEPQVLQDINKYIRLFLVILSLVLFYFSLKHFNSTKIVPAIGMFLAGAVMLGLGLKNLTHTKPVLPVWGEYAIVAGLVALAFYIRVYDIADNPPGLSFDEGLSIHIKARLFQGISEQLFLENHIFQVAITYYWLAALWAKITQPVVENIRVLSALAGALSVGFIYLTVKELLCRRTAVIAAVITTIFYYHIIYSRIAWLWIFVVLFAAIAFWLYFKGENTGEAGYYVLSGVFIGFGLYFYNAAKMVPFVLAAYWLYLLVSKRYRKWFLSNIPLLVMLVISALIAFLPLLHYIFGNSAAYFARINSESLVKSGANLLTVRFLEILYSQFLLVFQMFITKSSAYGYFNLPFTPLLDKVLSFFFLAGLGVVFFTIKRKQSFFLFVLLVISLSAAVFSTHGGDPNAQRAVLSIIPVVIIISVGINAIWDSVRAINVNIGRVVMPVMLVMALSYSALWTYQIYFLNHKNDNNVKAEFFHVPATMAKYPNSFEKDTKLYISPFFLHQTSFVVYGNDLSYVNTDLPEHNLLYNKKGKKTVIMAEAVHESKMDYYKEYYENVVIKKYYDFYSDIENKKYFYRNPDITKPRLFYVGAELEADAVGRAQALTAVYKGPEGVKELAVKNSQIERVDRMELSELKGLVFIPAYGKYEFTATGADKFSIYIDGTAAAGSLNLYRGLHKITVKFSDIRETPVLMWKKPGQAVFEPVGDEFFLNSQKLYGLTADYTCHTGRVYKQLEISPTHRYSFLRSRVPRWEDTAAYKVKWTGKFIAGSKAEYTFTADTMYDTVIMINGQRVFSNEEAGKISRTARLDKGRHDIIITYNFTGTPLVFEKNALLRVMYSKNGGWVKEIPYTMLAPY